MVKIIDKIFIDSHRDCVCAVFGGSRVDLAPQPAECVHILAGET